MPTTIFTMLAGRGRCSRSSTRPPPSWSSTTRCASGSPPSPRPPGRGPGARVPVVARAPDLEGNEPFDLEARWRLPSERVLFVFPTGIRPVKGPRVPLAPFDDLVRRLPHVRLLYAGPVVDPGEGDALRSALAARPWACHVGAVPHAQMRSLLAQSDVVLNCS